jgi:tRNA(fMet)-specific endonuclease VapC
MTKYMLDTNTCIYVIKKKPMDVIDRLRKTRISQVGISSITLSELEYGVSKSSKPAQNQIALAQFLAPMEILPYGDEAAQHYGKIRAFLEKRGNPIESLDTLIAAHALSKDCILVTNNEREFKRVPKLEMENWVG